MSLVVVVYEYIFIYFMMRDAWNRNRRHRSRSCPNTEKARTVRSECEEQPKPRTKSVIGFASALSIVKTALFICVVRCLKGSSVNHLLLNPSNRSDATSIFAVRLDWNACIELRSRPIMVGKRVNTSWLTICWTNDGSFYHQDAWTARSVVFRLASCGLYVTSSCLFETDYSPCHLSLLALSTNIALP